MTGRLLKSFRYFGDARVFLINLSLVISIFVCAIFAGIYLRNYDLVIETVRQQAASEIDLIVRARSWNAMMKGVYVDKKAGVSSNPFLMRVGVTPDIECSGGRTLTLRNPSIMIKEISEQTSSSAGVSFHMTSLKPLNPANAPDAFERHALDLFNKGDKEVWEIDRTAGAPRFRYMAPLFIDSSCLPCHGISGYKAGDIRGGISVNIPFKATDDILKSDRMIIAGVCILTVCLLLGIVYFMGWRMVEKLEVTRALLSEMAATDDLTRLFNRRAVMERLNEEFRRARRSREPLGIIMLDIDHFKNINDSFGHPFGDAVLQEVAQRIKSCLREYDVVGRVGGEEFFVLCANADGEELGRLADRLCMAIKSAPIEDGKHRAEITASAGITSLTDEDASPEELFRRADQALYHAKNEGRDRVVSV